MVARWGMSERLGLVVAALLERETLGEREILEVTGLPPAPDLLNRPLSVQVGIPK